MNPPLLAFYGDDLTGSTDVMEALELSGLRTVLFTHIPDETLMARFAGFKACGIAGTSRSETPEWMNAHLPAIFRWLDETKAEICHYKVCSTFDSAPEIGSIGRALDLGAIAFDQQSVPIVVGAPQLKRWTAFGNLYADFRGERHRIDRHPVMSRHPVTPMTEADLRIHLGRQTERTIGLIDCVTAVRPEADGEVDAALRRHGAVLIDVLDMATQAAAGRQLWRKRHEARFVVGSSGVEYALTCTQAGTPLAGHDGRFEPAGGRGPIAAVSGSCSPTTSRQIRHALANGFTGVPVDAARLSGKGEARDAEIACAVYASRAAIAGGRSALVYSALEGETAMDAAGGGGHVLGRSLGDILAAIVEREGLGRAIVAGGDTSSHAISALGIAALECRMPIPNAPGSPLCTAHSSRPGIDAFQIAFKGGQVGGDDYFVRLRDL